MHNHPSLTTLAATLVALTYTCGCGDETPAQWQGSGTSLRVMTRNVYLGGDFVDVINTPSLAELPGLVAKFRQAVKDSDFPARARLMADEIAAENPDIVSIQELELFRVQAPSDFDVATPAINAETTETNGDFVAIIQAELAARGLPYGAPVAVATHGDAEMPGQTDASSPAFDLRMTDRDVIFARADLAASNPRTADFATFISFPVPLKATTADLGKSITVKLVRGYAAVDVVKDGVSFTFAATHLEVGDGLTKAFQEGQAKDLVAALAPIHGPLILVGDFNSDGNKPAAKTTASYSTMINEGKFFDAWKQVNPADPGYSCCADIADQEPARAERIDLILFRGHVRAESAVLTGADHRTPSGLLASDHLGVAATLTVGN